MAFRRLSMVVAILVAPVTGLSQSPSASATAGASPAAAARSDARRDPAGYPFGSSARTRRDMQIVAKAMQLREYCADERLDEAFVRRQLDDFGRLTGRTESCRTLLDY